MDFLSIIFSLFILEVLLSIDNALVNAVIAEGLPEAQRKKAIRIGIILGAVFRVLALFLASFIIENTWIKVLGGLYLVYLAIVHLGKVIDSEGHTVKEKKDTFKGVVGSIVLADIVFSLDNVISAVSFSSRIEVVVAGVLIGVFSMLFITPILSKIIHKYKGMPQAAYTIVGFIGATLCLETLWHMHIGEFAKFAVILSVVGFTVWYEHNAALRRFSNPILRALQVIIALPVDIGLMALKAFKIVVGK